MSNDGKIELKNKMRMGRKKEEHLKSSFNFVPSVVHMKRCPLCRNIHSVEDMLIHLTKYYCKQNLNLIKSIYNRIEGLLKLRQTCMLLLS